MTSRSAFRPWAIIDVASNDPAPPGPPDRYTIGSGSGVAETAGARITKMRIRGPSGWARFSGTVRYPQLTSDGKSNSGKPGTFGCGHGVVSKDAPPFDRLLESVGGVISRARAPVPEHAATRHNVAKTTQRLARPIMAGSPVA